MNSRHSPLEIFRIYRALVRAGNIADYSGCEVYHFFFQQPNQPQITNNLYTLVRFISQVSAAAQAPRFLTPNFFPVVVEGAPLNFGIMYYQINLLRFSKFYRRFLRNNVWNLSPSPLTVGRTRPIPKQYVPSDGFPTPAINKVLKNNFFSGSYLIEHFDEEKLAVSPLIRDRSALLELSEKLGKIVPIRLGSVSDRLGNVVLQFPIEVVRTQFSPVDATKTVDAHIKVRTQNWTNRDLTLVSMNKDQSSSYIYGAGVGHVRAPLGQVAMTNDLGEYQHLLMDENENLILGSYKGGYFESVNFQMLLMGHEPRIVEIDGKEERIGICSVPPIGSFASAPPTRDSRSWEGERIFDAEQRELESKLVFVQYGAASGKKSADAVNDLVSLISQHGKEGVWLWDPYLNAADIKRILFRCKYADAELRAISSSEIVKSPEDEKLDPWRRYLKDKWQHFRFSPKERWDKKYQDWKTQQEAQLLGKTPNATLGVKLEFRLQHGTFGLSFHDRFIIFPSREGRVKAWSLGTSVNSMGGRKHHILQEVSHPGYVAQAFESLWNDLNHPSCLVWKR